MIEKYQMAEDMRGLAELTELSITLSHIVHTVQLERGASSLFLKNQGKKFSTKLSLYRSQTDNAITALNQFLQTFDTHYYNTRFNTQLDNVLKTLTRFEPIRKAITSLNIQQPQAVKRYTQINQILFEFILQSTHFSSYKDVFPLKLAYINFLKAKEKAGLERALLSAVFSQKVLEPGQFQQFVELVAVQDAYLNHDVMVYLTSAQKVFLKKKLFYGQSIKETTRIRKVIYMAEDANGILQESVDPEYWFKIQTEKINLLKEAGDKIAFDLTKRANEASKTARTEFINFLIMIIVVISLAIWFFVIVWKSSTTRLNTAVDIANAIAAGKLDNQIENKQKDEVGQLLQTLASMQIQLREHIDEEKRIAEEALRITRALDSATTNILITDSDLNIIYLNETAQQFFKNEQDKIRQDLPYFDVNRLHGANFDFFHKNPAHQRQLLSKLTHSRRIRITVGGLTLDHIITPAINANGEHLGIVVEFNNRTAEVATEQEINTVIQAASVGDFQQRIPLEGKSDFFQTISKSFNQIMDFNQQVIEDIVFIIAALAQGDLTKNIENRYAGAFDKLKNDINTTIQKLTDIMTAILQTAESVNNTAEKISQYNISLSQRTEQQAASLKKTAARMLQMIAFVQKNADNAQHATQLAINAKERAEKGGEVVGSTILAMTEITRSSQKITDIISVINEIAFQTNLLALNAAVEAARAGEQGRGFAVVASEVRNLAQRSAEAAKEIKALIEDSVTKVEEGTKLANQSGETLNEIVLSVKKVSNIIAEITTVSQKQSAGINQVNKAIAQMDGSTQQNAIMVEEAATTSNIMKKQAENLKKQVAFFKVGEQEPN
ncbi:methyl-accepting chemotaxis protein [Thiotrichales bacterium HSG14]|nr:methyl-accepting chemotaxis protein [Thiotrichales bacterium HSG14]